MITSNDLPNLIIIGAMKCGTSSLHRYLDLHPQICMSKYKELDFFIEEKNWHKGLDWYKSNFRECSTLIRGEASPNYTKCHIFKNVPERMFETIPEAKLIYVVRDPIKRILSHYLHQYTNRAEFSDVSNAFKNIRDNNYLETSRYAFQLKQFTTYYPPEQILTISSEDLDANRGAVLKQVFRFLQVDEQFEHPDFNSRFHQSKEKKRLTTVGSLLFKLPAGGRLLQIMPGLMSEDVFPPKMSEELRCQILDYLEDDIRALEEMTGLSFQAWRYQGNPVTNTSSQA